MNYVMLFEQFKENLLNEYNQSLVDKLIKKFTAESGAPGAGPVQSYISRFDMHKDNAHFIEKDITKYSWKDLEKAVDSMPLTRKEKLGVVPSVDGAQQVYNKGGIRAYLANDKGACLKLGNGYRWCISARGDDNMYDHYRHVQGGTPYFIFNDNLSHVIKDNGNYQDPNHALVIFNNGQTETGPEHLMHVDPFTVSDADNDGEVGYNSIKDIIKVFPFIKPLVNLLLQVEPGKNEKVGFDIKVNANDVYSQLRHDLLIGPSGFYNYFYGKSIFNISMSMLDKAIKGELVKYDLIAEIKKDTPDSFKQYMQHTSRAVVLDKYEFKEKLASDLDNFKKDIEGDDPDCFKYYDFSTKELLVPDSSKALMLSFYNKAKDILVKMQKDIRAV